MKKTFVFVVTFFSLTTFVWGYTPTAESLFRGGENPDILGSTVIVNVKASLLKNDESQSINGIDIDSLSQADREKYYKFLIYTDEEGNSRLLQLNYLNGFAKSDLQNIIYKPYYNYKNLGLNDEQVEKGVFYSLLLSLFANSGSMMIDMTRAHGGDLKKNRELFNQTQLQLISRYKWYMAQVKANPDLKNPLLAESSEEKEKLKEILSSPFYEKSSYVKRVRRDDAFFWEIDGDKLYARFLQTNRHLEKLIFKSKFGEIEINLKSYALFNAHFVFPQFLYYKDLTGLQYKIDIQKVVIIPDNADNFSKRYKSYQTELEGKAVASPPTFSPSFTY